MSYVVNNHLNNLYVAVGPEKNPKLINVGPTSIPEARVAQYNKVFHFGPKKRAKSLSLIDNAHDSAFGIFY